MPVAVAVTQEALDPAGLRREAARTRDAAAARRMLAIALVLDGRTRGEAAELCGLQPASRSVPPGDRFAMDRQTLRDWVRRYNVEGLAGLSDKPQPGAKPRLTPAPAAEVASRVEAGPELGKHGVVRLQAALRPVPPGDRKRWRRSDLRDRIAERFEVRLHERGVGKLLRRLRFRRLSPRPRHPGHDATAQASFGATSPPW